MYSIRVGHVGGEVRDRKLLSQQSWVLCLRSKRLRSRLPRRQPSPSKVSFIKSRAVKAASVDAWQTRVRTREAELIYSLKAISHLYANFRR